MKRLHSSPASAVRAITHAERVVDPTSGVTKQGVADHYAAVSELILPHLRERPVALVRAPDGVDGAHVFQRHADGDVLAEVERLAPELDPGHAPLLEIRSAGGLQSAAQMNTLELHTWNSTVRSIRKPDRIVFDLDPGEGVAWSAVCEATIVLHAFLRELGLKCFLKTSGGKGLHVVVPLMPSRSWEVVRGFARAIVERLADSAPDRFVAKSGPKNRVGRVFVDHLRNGWGATTVSAWSLRARPGLGVSVPVDWKELHTLTGGAHWTLATIERRLPIGNRPWEAYSASRQGLATAIRNFGFDPATAAGAASDLDHAAKEAA